MAYEYKELKCGVKLTAHRFIEGWQIEVYEPAGSTASVWGAGKGSEKLAGVGIADESLPDIIEFLQRLNTSHLKEFEDGSSNR